jgi:hypothetical protein
MGGGGFEIFVGRGALGKGLPRIGGNVALVEHDDLGVGRLGGLGLLGSGLRDTGVEPHIIDGPFLGLGRLLRFGGGLLTTDLDV